MPVAIPDEVLEAAHMSEAEMKQELAAAGTPGFAMLPRSHPAWVGVVAASDRPLVASLRLELHAGEAEAIALAIEQGADPILLDERLARRVAKRLGLAYVGLLGVLLEAKAHGVIAEVRSVLDDLIAKASFWVGADLRNYTLALAGE